MLITVERIEKRQGSKGVYHLVHLGEGRKLYCWDGKLAQELQPGAVYEVETRDGPFPALVRARLVRARQVASVNGAQPEHEAIVSQAVAATAQERLEALRLAMAMVGQVRPQDVPQVLEAAGLVLAFLRGEG